MKNSNKNVYTFYVCFNGKPQIVMNVTSFQVKSFKSFTE